MRRPLYASQSGLETTRPGGWVKFHPIGWYGDILVDSTSCTQSNHALQYTLVALAPLPNSKKALTSAPCLGISAIFHYPSPP